MKTTQRAYSPRLHSLSLAAAASLALAACSSASADGGEAANLTKTDSGEVTGAGDFSDILFAKGPVLLTDLYGEGRVRFDISVGTPDEDPGEIGQDCGSLSDEATFGFGVATIVGARIPVHSGQVGCVVLFADDHLTWTGIRP